MQNNCFYSFWGNYSGSDCYSQLLRQTRETAHLVETVVMAKFWARVLCSLAAEDACFRMRITLGVSLIRSLVSHLCVLECSWNGSVPENVPICGFNRNSSNLERAPKMRDAVLLNFWDSFLVTLPSISSETCVIYSSLILETDVYRDWPFLGCSSCVSLVTAANFVSQCCHFVEGKMLSSYDDWISFFCYSTWI